MYYGCIICDILGWIDPPGKPTFEFTNFSKSTQQDKIFLHANITWSPPQYLGGLEASDIYYQLQATGYSVNTTDTYSEFSSSTGGRTLDITITAHYNSSSIESMYIPSNVKVNKQYNLCNVVGEQIVDLMSVCISYYIMHACILSGP